MDTKYFEVKTDTQSVTTDNVALEIQIVHPTKKTIGCALKTFPDYLFYWIYPTNRLLYWNPTELNPYIIDWVDEKKYKHHEDGLPCLSDTNKKAIVKQR